MPIFDSPKFALSIRQPWAALVLLGLKTIEIRRWSVGLRGRIYLHAGKIADDRREGWVRVPAECLPLTELRGGIIGSIDLIECLTYSSGRQFARDHQLHFNEPSWFLPPRMFGFRLERPEILPFRQFPGQVKLFPVPPLVVSGASRTIAGQPVSSKPTRVKKRVTFEIESRK